MAQNCCNITLSNTGAPGTQCIEAVTRKIFLVNMRTGAGVANEIDLTGTLNEQYFTDWAKNADKSARIYPLQIVENVEDVRAEPIRQEFNSGYNPIVRKGTRSFTAMIPFQGAKYLAKLQALACGEIGVYLGTKDRQLVGNGATAGKLKPLKLGYKTVNFELVKGTQSEVPMIQVTFDFDMAEKDENLAFITQSDMGGYDILDLTGLLGVQATAPTAISATSFTQYFFTEFGSAIGGTPIQNLAIGDFALAEVSPTPGAISISTSTETAPGKYTFTFTSQTAADVLQASVVAAGFENENIPTATIPA
jgi:hypothetical protein